MPTPIDSETVICTWSTQWLFQSGSRKELAKRDQQVLDALLAEVMVDAEDVRFVEDASHGLVDGLGTRQVGADGLLEDHPRAVGGQAELVEVLADRAEEGGRHREVEDADHLVAGSPVLEPVVEPVPRRDVLDVQRHVEQSSEQALGDRRVQLVGRDVLDQGVLHQGPVSVVVNLRARDADDPEAVGQLAVAVSQVQGRQQLAQGEVAGAAEDGEVTRLDERSVHVTSPYGPLGSLTTEHRYLWNKRAGYVERRASCPPVPTAPSPPGATAGDLLALIRSGGATTRGELGRITGLSRTAVNARLAALSAAGLVLEGDEESATGGRPASTLVLNRDAGLVLAVAIGRSRSQLAVCALDGTELAQVSHDQEIGVGPDVLMPVVAGHLARMLAEVGRSGEDVIGVGLSLPGTVDPARW